jgi:hypothetical protein
MLAVVIVAGVIFVAKNRTQERILYVSEGKVSDTRFAL